MTDFRGTGVAMVTPFTADGAIDFDALRKLTTNLITGGVEFLVILGTTGESATLSPDEQVAVIDAILETNAGRLPYVLGAGGNDTRKVCKQVEAWTQKYMPTAFLSVSPYYNKPSQEGIVAHFSAVAGSTDVPIILYNVPGRTSSNMTAATTLELAHAFDHVVAVKEASGNLEQGMEIIRGRPQGFQVLSGDDILTLPMIGANFDGVISVAGNVVPGPFSAMVRAALAGDFARARELHYLMMPLMQFLFKEGNPAGVKAALQASGVGTPHVRLPLVQASDALRADIKKALTMLVNA